MKRGKNSQCTPPVGFTSPLSHPQLLAERRIAPIVPDRKRPVHLKLEYTHGELSKVTVLSKIVSKLPENSEKTTKIQKHHNRSQEHHLSLNCFLFLPNYEFHNRSRLKNSSLKPSQWLVKRQISPYFHCAETCRGTGAH